MRSSSSLLWMASLGLAMSGCAAATPGPASPVAGGDGSPPAPGSAPVPAAATAVAVARVRIPARMSAPEDRFERIQRMCSAARALRRQYREMQAPPDAGKAGPGGDGSGGVAAGEDVVNALRRFQDEVRAARALEEQAKAVPPVSSPGVAAPKPSPAVDLSQVKELYRVFLSRVATVADECDVIDGTAELGPAGSTAKQSLDAARQIAERSEREVALLEQQVEAGVSVWKETRASGLEPLLYGGAQGAPGAAAPAAAPGLGSLETALLNGLADFMVTRAKAEAIHWVKEHLTAELCGRSGALLPHLCLAFKDLDPALSLQAMGAYLQAAALEDLEGLPEALLLQDPGRKDEASALLLGMTLFREVYAGRSPIEAARNVQHVTCKAASEAGKWGKIAPAACAGSALIDAIVRQRRAGVGTDGTPSSQMRELAVAALLSLQQSLKDEAAPLDGLSAKEFEALVNQVQALAAEVEGLEKDLRSVLAEAKGGKVPAEARLAVATRTVAVLLHSARSSVCLVKSAGCKPGEEAPVVAALSFMESAAGFASALYSHDAGSMAIAVRTALSALGELTKKHPEWEPVRRVLPFVVELASAKESKDVAAALEAAAAPVNSYEAKFDRSSIAINAFVGGSVGPETTSTGKWAGVVSLSAPVGVHVTTPLGSGKSMVHGGLFVSVIDLGALTATRLEKEVGDTGEPTVETAPSVGFAQVFSPGILATLGIGRSPVVLGLGASVTPSLRKATIIGQSGTTVEEIPAIRLQLLLGIDVPILPF